ncbi:type 1 glutamine amidotransferase [Sediminicoccus sp. KRV36]|uniref:glutamine amidotransferase-related protein n=1 Tax=Sediminicoccus sp. KRV36 TaxID=3133721 RepID=UPI00200F815C|nr:type 1 glutamine amidotransferase [Sediminicoccus rosea]UPY37860.1 type 1 glutamine amidotransferase [Sediminicoccus rosea]
MKIGILQCGAVPEELEAEHGRYGAMVQRLLPPARDTVLHDVTAGDLPHSPTDCEAWLLTGSPAGVYDDLPWIAPLMAFLRQARGRTKLVGICFGHQAMAQAWGGRVVKSPKGWGIGLHRYDVRQPAAWMEDRAAVHVPASHQDQVVEAPAGARVTIANEFTPLAGLDYGDAVSFQCHPEFTPEFGVALLQSRRDRFGPLAGPAIASLARPHDCARVAQWIRRFLEG